MNSSKQLLKRLLKLYPVQILKEYFTKKGNAVIVIQQIVETSRESDILNFAATHFNYGKQHIYFHELQPNFNSKKFDIEGFPCRVISWSESNGEVVINALPLVGFDVIVLNPYEETTIKFYQPVRITISTKHVVFQTITLEKDLSSYFSIDEERRVVNSVRNNGEDVSIKNVINFLADELGYSSRQWELEKAIKEMWGKDIIDSKYVKHKKTRSTATEAMDEEFMVKEVYPEVYKEIIKNPLIKTLFKYKGKDGSLPDHFSADPRTGLVGVSSFSSDVSQIEKLINEIVKHNK
jgi:hypothetical protein